VIKFSPLGGLGEIGSNMVLFDDGHSGLIIDAGIMFPYDDAFNINYLIPNFAHLDPKYFSTLLLTHAHEDHIGAVEHLLKWNPKLKVMCTPFTKLMVQKRLTENNVHCSFINMPLEGKMVLDQWTIQSIEVNHSIPETQGLVIGHFKEAVAFFYCSDFKVNTNDCDGPAFKNKKVLQAMQQYPNRIAMLDSTNILKTGKTVDEGTVLEGLDSEFKKSGRIFITFFASNISRFRNIIRLSKKYHRPIVAVGRSVWNMIHLMDNAGDSLFSKENFLDLAAVQGDQSRQYVFIVAGCQGDHQSSVKRIAYGEDIHVKPGRTDRFLFSSKAIPGNEENLSRIYNKLTEQGCTVICDSQDMRIHCSGHASQEDLKLMIQDAGFTHYVPVHGESYFLKKHQEFVQSYFPELKTQLLFNGESLLWNNNDWSVVPNKEWQLPVLIHGQGIEIERPKISERRKLAESGLLVVTMTEKNIKTSLVGLPELAHAHSKQFEEDIRCYLNEQLKNETKEKCDEKLRIYSRNWFAKYLGYKPVTIIHQL
jgi:ribonuclease J